MNEHLKIFTDKIESTAQEQVYHLAKSDIFKDSKIRIMPDVHAGTGCTVGTTMTITDKVVPNLVGVDIGCGVLCVKLSAKKINFSRLDKLDNVIKNMIPSGFNIHDYPIESFDFDDLICKNFIDLPRAARSLGSLGGGNHFIEIDRSDSGDYYLIIHTGSRHMGLQVCKYYQDLAVHTLNDMKGVKEEMVRKLKAQHREKEIETELKKIQKPAFDKQLAYLEGTNKDNYLHDMGITQMYANRNRHIIVDTILDAMNWYAEDAIESVHNYIDLDNMILRKGSVSAQKGERLIIPINMRDGSLLCTGLGNEDWNYSAPHGAGRVMSRSKAKESISLNAYKKAMVGIYSTTINKSTIDESPFAYKSTKDIVNNIKDTVEINETIYPVYNFKVGE